MTQTTKHSTKTIRELSVIPSDRVSLVSEANSFVARMVDLRVLPQLGSSPFATQELTSEESATYRAALDFLRRQFETGFRESDVVETKSERETNKETSEVST